MRIVAMSKSECKELLRRASLGRLGCSLHDQPYVVPVGFAYGKDDRIYLFSTVGKKIEYLRQNPRVCLQTDEIGSSTNWLSVVVEGNYVELQEPQYTAERQYAIEQLSDYSSWWKTPLAQRREKTEDISVEPVFFRIEITAISGLRATADV
jgi:nitroimidazol reductase NimA-like FMN-containing flavoprotein (pyridoxamine 5'-phosphate oxidase superfamily)